MHEPMPRATSERPNKAPKLTVMAPRRYSPTKENSSDIRPANTAAGSKTRDRAGAAPLKCPAGRRVTASNTAKKQRTLSASSSSNVDIGT